MATYPLSNRLSVRADLQRATGWLLLALGLFAGVGISILFVRSLMVPYLGADITLREGLWRVNQVDSNGTAYRDGIRFGDVVVTVNGMAPGEVAKGFDYIGAHRAQALEVQDATGRIKGSSSAQGPMPAGSIQESIGLYTVSVAFWLVGFISLLKRPTSRSTLFLYLMCIAVAVAPMASLDTVRGSALGRHLEALSLILAPWLVARFFFEFPYRKSLSINRMVVTNLVFLPAFLLILAYFAAGQDDSGFYSWFRPTNMVNLMLGFPFALGVAIHSYYGSSFTRFRQQMRIIAVSAVIGLLPLLVLSIVPEALGQGYLVSPSIASMGLIALPLSLGYVILRDKLLDIDHAINRVTWYGLLSCALVACYVLLISFTEMLFPGLGTGWQVLLLIAFTAAVLASSAPARIKLQQEFETRLNLGRYDYRRAAADIIADLTSQTDLENVAQLLATDVSRFLKLEGACVLLNLEGKGHKLLASHGCYADQQTRQRELLDYCRSLGEDHQFPNPASAESGAALLVPLSRGRKQIGILALSKRASESKFTVDDIYFLFSIQSQGSLAIDNALLLKEAKARAVDLEHAVERLEEYTQYLEYSRSALEQSYIGIIRTLVLAVESRSPYTKGHSERVTQLARRIGMEMGLRSDELHDLQVAARIHDIGKMGISDHILLKPGPLEHHERAEIELHPFKGVEIVRFLDFLRGALPMIESHHEWYSGGGYPRGLRGDEIPLGARIIAVADAFDAMTSDRPYRKACTSIEAIKLLCDGSGSQWDSRVVEAIKNLPGLDGEDA